jgi:hypothetical protein
MVSLQLMLIPVNPGYCEAAEERGHATGGQTWW